MRDLAIPDELRWLFPMMCQSPRIYNSGNIKQVG